MNCSPVLIEKQLLTLHHSPVPLFHLNAPLIRRWLWLPLLLLSTGWMMAFVLGHGLPDRTLYWQMQQDLFLTLNHGFSALPATIWSNLTELGDATVLAPLAALATLHKRQAWMAVLGALPFAAVFSLAGKKLAAVPRPAAVLDTQSFEVIGSTLTAHNSMPSGHSITVFAVLVAWLVITVPRPRTFQEWRWVALVTSSTLALAISRIAVGAHWPLDVMAGAALGSLAGILGASLALRRNWQGPTSPPGCIAASTLLLTFVAVLCHRLTYESVDFVVWLALFAGILVATHLLCENRFAIKLTVSRTQST